MYWLGRCSVARVRVRDRELEASTMELRQFLDTIINRASDTFASSTYATRARAFFVLFFIYGGREYM